MRHIEKLKKIFSCCGKTCVKNTNGEALDELLTLAENGELGGGGGSTPKLYGWQCEDSQKRHIEVFTRLQQPKNGDVALIGGGMPDTIGIASLSITMIDENSFCFSTVPSVLESFFTTESLFTKNGNVVEM